MINIILFREVGLIIVSEDTFDAARLDTKGLEKRDTRSEATQALLGNLHNTWMKK